MTFPRDRDGFTLIEILIVIIVLGILAMIIVPQITVSTDDAKVSTTQSDLSYIRSVIQVYFAQHADRYPGQTGTDGAANTSAATAAAAMVAQLTQYTADNGRVSAVKTGTYKFGPYLKSSALPLNPFNELTNVVCDATSDITVARAPNSSYGWKFHFNTGVFYAADNTEHTAY